MAESMVAILLIALLSMGIATGVAFGARQYGNAVSSSEARLLCSTLENIIRDELRNATTVSVDSTTEVLTGYGISRNFTPANATSLSRFVAVNKSGTESSDKYGYIEVWTKAMDSGVEKTKKLPVLSTAAYSRAQDLTAKVEVKYFESQEKFQVQLSVKTPDAGTVTTTFDLFPLNPVTVKPAT